MVLTAADIHGWQNLILWKKDLKGAFNLLNYNPEYCRLFTFPLSDDVTMIRIVWLDRTASRLSSFDKVTAGNVFLHHFWALPMLC